MMTDLVKQWDEYVESMGSVMGEVEHMAQQMADSIDALAAKLAEVEAALPAVYRLSLDEGANVAASGTSRNDTYSKGRNDAAAAIRALPTATAEELMVRIQTGEKE